MRVLILDPDWRFARRAQGYLESLAHLVVVAPHAREAGQKVARWQPDLKRLERLRSAVDMKQRDYAESWAWVHFLLETDPDSRQLLRDYLRGARRPRLRRPTSGPRSGAA